MCFSAPKPPKPQDPLPPPSAPTPMASEEVTGKERQRSGGNRPRGIASLTIPMHQSGTRYTT